MKENSQMLKILECLDLEGALTNKKIAEITGVPSGTVRCYTSLLTHGPSGCAGFGWHTASDM
jgi:DNA-binding IclR family transcriptional regulator